MSIQPRIFYIKATGSDANTGLSDAQAWQTVSHVNAQTMLPGDVYNFNGGDTFSGTTLTAGASGSADGDITFQSYGTGQATISVSAADGFSCTNFSYIKVNNIAFTGPGSGITTTPNGIRFVYSSGNNNHITIRNVNVTGFAASGIHVDASGGGNINGIVIDQCTVNNCTWGYNAHHSAGIDVAGVDAAAPNFNISNVVVSRCVSKNNPGKSGGSSLVGAGINFFDVLNARISQCVAHDNGSVSNGGSGTVAIWGVGLANVNIEYCEAYNQKAPSASSDAGGFDIDGNAQNCILQYCYSHNNNGNGLMIFGGDDGSGNGGSTNCIIRFCVSENDAQDAGRAHQGIVVTSSNAHKTLGALVYGNVVYMSANLSGTNCIQADAQSGSGLETQAGIYNNIFWATTSNNNVLLDNVHADTGSFTTTYAGNDYYDPATSSLINWNGTNYASLAAFQAGTGQEKFGGNPVGFQVNPGLNNAGSGGTLNVGSYVTPAMFKAWTPYQQANGSPMFRTGLNLVTDFSVALPAVDLFETGLKAPTLSVGANCP